MMEKSGAAGASRRKLGKGCLPESFHLVLCVAYNCAFASFSAKDRTAKNAVFCRAHAACGGAPGCTPGGWYAAHPHFYMVQRTRTVKKYTF
jgi:hypothetical protein